MKIVISDNARKILTDDEYKYLVLLEFNKKFTEDIKLIRIDLGMTKPHNVLDLDKLYDKSLELVLKLNIPISLLFSVEDIIRFGAVLRATPPILILGISNQFNRKLLYNHKIYRSFLKQTTKEEWYRDNQEILRKESLAAAYPLIQINKRLKIGELHKTIEENWNQIESAFDEFEKSSPYPTKLKEVSRRDIEIFASIYRCKKILGLSSKETYKEILKNFKIRYSEEDREIDRKYLFMSKLLKELGFVDS